MRALRGLSGKGQLNSYLYTLNFRASAAPTHHGEAHNSAESKACSQELVQSNHHKFARGWDGNGRKRPRQQPTTTAPRIINDNDSQIQMHKTDAGQNPRPLSLAHRDTLIRWAELLGLHPARLWRIPKLMHARRLSVWLALIARKTFCSILVLFCNIEVILSCRR